ncbi:Tigger transposable element-derived protein 6 [Dictyocoela muelleri]|nr:Tigger transposable element-derived protein 6 [Dictyocoela muelleri]
MTTLIFKDWLENLNNKMRSENRKILLTLDNASVHLVSTEYSNVELFFSPNVSSVIQPCDQGVIKAFKTYYRSLLSNKIIFDLDNPKNENLRYTELIKNVTIYDALCFIHTAWESISSVSIINCYKHALKNSKIDDLKIIKCDQIEDLD